MQESSDQSTLDLNKQKSTQCWIDILARTSCLDHFRYELYSLDLRRDPPATSCQDFGRGRERQPCRDPRRLQAESLGGAPWRPDVLGWVADVFFLDALPTIDDNRWLMMFIDWLIYVNTCWYMLIQYTSVHPYCWGSAFFYMCVCFRIDERTMPLSFDMFRRSHGDTWFSHWWMMSCEPIYEIYWECGLFWFPRTGLEGLPTWIEDPNRRRQPPAFGFDQK